MSGPVEAIERKPDDDKPFEMIDAVVEDMLEAFHKKDKGMLKAALEALIEHIKSEDEVQDQSLIHKEF